MPLAQQHKQNKPPSKPQVQINSFYPQPPGINPIPCEVLYAAFPKRQNGSACIPKHTPFPKMRVQTRQTLTTPLPGHPKRHAARYIQLLLNSRPPGGASPRAFELKPPQALLPILPVEALVHVHIQVLHWQVL